MQGAKAFVPLRRVLIIGVRPHMRERLNRMFNGRCQLEFYDDPTGSSGLLSRARRADFIVLNSELARHSHQAVLRQSPTPFALSSGAATGIAREIEKYLGSCAPT